MNKFTFKSFLCALSLLLAAQFSHAQCTTVYDTLRPIICAGDSFDFNGVWHKTSTTIGGRHTFSDTVQLGTGCDSITFLGLTVLRPVKDSFVQQICTGSTYNFNGQMLTTSGIYKDTLLGASIYGCDSTVTINLTVGGAVSHNEAASICLGDSLLFGAGYVRTAGTYYDTVVGGVSCDSIVVLTLTYLPIPITTINATFCQGGSYTLNGNTYTAAGTYYDTLFFAAASGCDSVVKLVYEPTVVKLTIRDTLCYGDTLYIPGGYYIPGSSSGLHHYAPDTLVTTCADSVFTYTVYVDSPAAPIITSAGTVLSETLTGFIGYQWQLGGADVSGTAMTYTALVNGTYTVLGIDSLGCSAVSNAITITDVGINNVAGNIKARIFPNPNNGSFELQTSNATGATIAVYDVLGKEVGSATVTSDVTNIDMDLPAGVYMLRLKDNAGNLNTMTFTISK